MQRHPFLLAVSAGVFLVLAGAIGHLTSVADTPDDKPADAKQATLTSILGGGDRYLTHVSLDKPIYRPGEKVRVRAVILHHATHRPMDQPVHAVIQVKGPKGEQVASGVANTEDSVMGFEWVVPATQAGGQYAVHVNFPHQGHAPAKRSFDVRAYRPPRLNSQIKFLRDGYGPSDEVVATLETQRAEGGIPSNAPVTIVARVDGEEVHRAQATVDGNGRCLARFRLPRTISRGEGTLAMIIDDGGAVETASKTIPILLQTVDLRIYPEGGDLVEGLESRVYFEAFTPVGKPADLAGTIVNGQGETVAEFRSEHEGRGRFLLTPETGQEYFLQIDEPSGINTEYPLPKAKPQGVILRIADDLTAANGIVRAHVTSTTDGQFIVALNKRELRLDTRKVTLAAGKTRTVELQAGQPDGVLTVAVMNGKDQPLAERLTFRRPHRIVQLRIDADQSRYVPGGKATLTLQTTDESGRAVPAMVGVTVTDESVLELIEKREQAPRLPVMVLLENDVRELADAHVYLDPENADAPRAVDLLLGTQGWRRFALINLTKFVEQHGESARRALALRVPISPQSQFGRHRFWSFRGVDRFRRLRDKGEIDELNAEGLQLEELRKELAGVDARPNEAAPESPVPPASKEDSEGDDAFGLAADQPANASANGPVPDLDVAAAEDGASPAREQKALQQLIAGDRSDRLLMDAQLREPVAPVADDFVAIRVYGHQLREARPVGERSDFTETLYWHAGVRTDASGKATVEFDLNDSVTSFRIHADAFSRQGGLGSETTRIESVEPFYTEPKVPLEVTSGDLVQIPIGIVNATSQPFESVKLKVSSTTWKSIQSADTDFTVAADQRIRKSLGLRIGNFQGQADLTIQATAGPYSDQVTRTLNVKPLGFPIEDALGGMLNAESVVTHEVTVPGELIPGSLRCRVAVHPTPLARMSDALERLIQEPCGCFEQTSSSTFPLVMAQQYFMSHAGVDPSLIERSAVMLNKGYERLIGFECKSHGFEWFGNDPGHDALTAYGLLEFTEMSKVRSVDANLLSRTRQWLLDQRDGKGGYERKTHTLHTWIADPACANSYNTWALLEAGVDADLTAEVKWARQAAEASSNTYVLALAANIMLRAGEEEATNQILDRLAGRQSDNGSLAGATTSVVGSGGEALTVETTALAMIAWMQDPAYTHHVEQGMTYLAEVCKSGRFGSTQSTILALRAIVEYDRLRATPKAPGSLQLTVDGQAVGQPVPFEAESHGVLVMPAASGLLTPGTHQIELQMTGGSDMPYTVTLDYHSTRPNSSDQCKLALATRLSETETDEGEVTEVNVTVTNKADEILPNPVAIIGVPGGLEVRHDQLKELVKAGSIAAYEVRGREVVLYWRSLRAEEQVELPISVVAAFPGRFNGPASRVYQYYTDEHKQWDGGLTASVRLKE